MTSCALHPTYLGAAYESRAAGGSRHCSMPSVDEPLRQAENKEHRTINLSLKKGMEAS